MRLRFAMALHGVSFIEREWTPAANEVWRDKVNELLRGEIIRVRLDPVEGSEQTGDRPGLVISPDLINQH